MKDVLKLKKFDVSTMRHNAFCLFLGARDETDQVEVIIDFLKPFKDYYKNGIVMSKNNKFFDKEFSKTFPYVKVYDSILMDKLKELCNEENDNTFLILDPDVASDERELWSNEVVDNLTLNGRRHFKTSVLVPTCRINLISLSVLVNIDYLFLSKLKDVNVIKDIYKRFDGAFDTKEEFINFSYHYTKNEGILVKDNLTFHCLKKDGYGWSYYK